MYLYKLIANPKFLNKRGKCRVRVDTNIRM